MAWNIVIPNWCPPSLNKGRGRHFGRAAKCVGEVVEYLRAYNTSAEVPLVDVIPDGYRPVRKLTVTVLKAGTLPDPDNLLKYLLDGLKRCRLIVDDAARWCQWSTPNVANPAGATPGTVITLEDVEDAPAAVQLERGESLHMQVSRLCAASEGCTTADMLVDVADGIICERTYGGIEFTRAAVVVRPFYFPHDKACASHGDFRLYANLNGNEAVFLSDVACTEYQLRRLVDWAKAMGLPVEWDRPKAEAKRAAKPAGHDSDLFG